MSRGLERILYWYFNKKSLPYWCILLLDSVVLLVSRGMSNWLFNGGQRTLMHSRGLFNSRDGEEDCADMIAGH